ncbi:MAG: GNAT family N-acetyltransferase [Paenibacillaceae bacterium]
MIAKRRPTLDDTIILQLIKDELLPLAVKRFPDTLFNKDELMHRLSIGTTYVWKERIGRIAGFVHLFIQDQIVWVDMIAVHRLQQGKGIGHKLINQAVNFGKSNRMNAISLYVDKSNRKAIQFYKSLGFRSIQYHPHIFCYELSRAL